MSNRGKASGEGTPALLPRSRTLQLSIFRLVPPWPLLLLILASSGFVLEHISVAHARVTYPYALDLVEEDMLMQAWRSSNGQSMFLPPNAEFVPQVYMPLFVWLGGQMLRLSGPEFWPLRLLSLSSTLATSLLIFWIGHRESKRRAFAFGGAALYLAGYRLVGGWTDLARVDALFVALTLAAMAMAVYGRSWNRRLLFSGILMGLAFLAKQNGLVLAAVAGLYFLLAGGRRVWIYGLAFACVSLPPALFLEWRSHGWFSYYVVEIAYASPLSVRSVWHTLSRELAGGMGFLILAALLAAVLPAKRLASSANGWRRLKDSPWLLYVSAAAVVSVAGRSSVGGGLNNLMPAYALFCLSPALLIRALEEAGMAVFASSDGRTPTWLSGLLVAGVLGQFGLTIFNPIVGKPAQYRPTDAMEASGDRLVQMLAQFDGEVFVLMHPSYALKAGKEPAVHIQSLWHARHRGRDPLPADFIGRIASQQYGLVISDDSDFFEKDPSLQNLLQAYYREARRLATKESPPTLSGPIIRPLIVYEPLPYLQK
jgi:hypothetical protein